MISAEASRWAEDLAGCGKDHRLRDMYEPKPGGPIYRVDRFSVFGQLGRAWCPAGVALQSGPPKGVGRRARG